MLRTRLSMTMKALGSGSRTRDDAAMIPGAPVREPAQCTAMIPVAPVESPRWRGQPARAGVGPLPFSQCAGEGRFMALQRHDCRSPGSRTAHCTAMKRHDCKSRSPRQSTKGCGAAQRGRRNARVCGDCTVSQQPVGMRRFGVQGCNALAVGVSGAAARP
jgi:hypothetical protein